MGHTLNGDCFTWEDLLLAEGIEDCYARAQLRCEFNGIDVFGDVDDCFGAECDVLAVPAISGDAVDYFVVAHLGETSTTGLAGVYGSGWLAAGFSMR